MFETSAQPKSSRRLLHSGLLVLSLAETIHPRCMMSEVAPSPPTSPHSLLSELLARKQAQTSLADYIAYCALGFIPATAMPAYLSSQIVAKSWFR
jgi:hypothetical protein